MLCLFFPHLQMINMWTMCVLSIWQIFTVFSFKPNSVAWAAANGARYPGNIGRRSCDPEPRSKEFYPPELLEASFVCDTGQTVLSPPTVRFLMENQQLQRRDTETAATEPWATSNTCQLWISVKTTTWCVDLFLWWDANWILAGESSLSLYSL